MSTEAEDLMMAFAKAFTDARSYEVQKFSWVTGPAYDELVQLGLIEMHGAKAGWRLTEAGNAWVLRYRGFSITA